MNVIKWVGSKRKTAFAIVNLFDKLPEKPRRFFEPMCGGMSVAISYKHPTTIVNDINPHLINFYHVLSNTDSLNEFYSYFKLFKNDREFYLKIRDEFNHSPITFDVNYKMDVYHAAMYYYLVSYGFRGLSRYNKNGKFNTAFGNVVADPELYLMIKRNDFIELNSLLSQWMIWNKDYKDFDFEAGDLVYFDPPYSESRPYYAQTDLNEFLEFVNWLSGKGVKVAISYDKGEEIVDRLSKDFNVHTLDSFYTFSTRKVPESLFVNF